MLSIFPFSIMWHDSFLSISNIHFPFSSYPEAITYPRPTRSPILRPAILILPFSRGVQEKFSGEEDFMEEGDGEEGFSSGSVSLDGDEPGSHDGQRHPTLRPHFS